MRFLIEISENGFTKMSPVPARMSMTQTSALLGISRTSWIWTFWTFLAFQKIS